MCTGWNRLGWMGAVAGMALLAFMAWALGGRFMASWFGLKSEKARQAGRNLVSDRDKLDVYRRMIADDAPVREKIHEIASLQNQLKQEREALASLEKGIAALTEMMAMLVRDLESHPGQERFSYRTAHQAEPRLFPREAVEQDLVLKSKELTSRRTRLAARRAKIEVMERRERVLRDQLAAFEQVRAEAFAEMEHAEYLKAVADEIQGELARLSENGGTATDGIQRGAEEVRRLNGELRQRIEEGRMRLATQQAGTGLDPRSPLETVDAVTRAKNLLNDGTVSAAP